MTREEYLEKKNQAIPITTQHEITSLSEYMNLREQIAEFEQQQIVYTEEDFEAFDHNFLNILDVITCESIEDGNVSESDVDKCIQMMKSIDWEWKKHTPDYNEFIKTIRELYERAMKASMPRYAVEQNGFRLTTDIYKHKVSLTWGKIICDFCDKEE